MKKPFWSWVNACGKLGYRVFRRPKWNRDQRDINPDGQILQMQAESLEERQMLAADLSNFQLANDDGVDPNDLITTDPTVTATVVGDYNDFSMGITKVEFDHHGDGSVEGEYQLYYPDEVITYDPITNEASLDTYQGQLNIRWRVVTTDMMGSEIYSTGWNDFIFEKGVANSPEIQVVDAGLVEVTSGSGVVNFGTTELNTPISQTFTIYNWGTADLTIDLNSFTVPAGFSLTSNPAATVAANGSTTFTIQYDASSSGLQTGTFSFMTNDADESNYNFDLIGTVDTPQPELEIRNSSGRHLINGDPNSVVDFGSTIDGTPLYVRLAITNHGDADLTLDLNSITLPTGYSVESNPDATVSAKGGRTYITLKLDATTIGSYAGTFSINSNDPDDGTYTVDLTGEVTDEYTISISNFGLTNDTGTWGDNSTYDPQVQGWISGNLQGGSIEMQFDHDGDGSYDGFVTVINPMEMFSYDPRDTDPGFVATTGAKNLRHRFVRLDGSGIPVETGDWQDFNFTLEYDPSLGDVTIDHFGLAHDTGDDNEDKITVSPRLTGMINGPLGGGYVQVEFDHVGDGTISGTTQVNESGEVFIYDPRDVDAALVGFVGAVTINYRLVRYDANDVVQETGNWTGFSFTMEALPAGEITIDDLALANDTTDGSAGGDTDKITYDPTLVGTGTIPVDSNGDALVFTTPIVEFDYDADGIVDHREYLEIDNNGGIAFEVLPTDLTYGSIDAAARIVYWDPNYSSYLTGAWANLAFTFEAKPAPDLSDLSLSNDTIGDDGNGSEEDETTNDTGSDGVTKDPTIKGQVDPETGEVAFVKIEFDLDGDGVVDDYGWTGRDGSFTYLPDGLAAGVHTVKARTARYDENLDITLHPDKEVKGEWTELTFTLERVSPYTLEDFKLLNDTPSDTSDATDDGITRDRRLTGQVGNGTDLWGVTIEFDYDGDDVFDATTYTDYNGKFFFDPVGIGFGQKTVRARAVAIDAYSGEEIYSDWSSVTFTIDEPDYQPTYITDLTLTDASGGETEAFHPVIEGRAMNPWSYPMGPTPSTETMELYPGYGEDTAAAYHSVHIDIDGDGTVDEVVQTDWDGQFYFAPAGQAAGTYTIQIRGESWDYVSETNGTGNWVSFEYTVLEKTDNPADISTFDVLPGTGLTDSDHVAAIIGTISNDTSLKGVAVEFDEDGDGVADGVAFTDENGKFHYTTGPMAFGAQTVKVRAVEWSHLHDNYQASGWTDVTFTLADDTVNDAPNIVDLELGNNEGSPTTIDYTTSDPEITGRVVNDGYLHDVWVEIDLDNDGSANHVVKSGAYGYFSFTAEGLDYGALDIKVRASEIDIASGTRLIGSWVTLSFTHQQYVTSTAAIDSFGLSEDTLSADGSGTDTDGITTNSTVTGTITNDDGVEGLTIEIDLDDDGVVDATALTDADGNFSYTPTDLEDGTHTVKVRVRQLDQDGNAQYSAWSSTTFELQEAANTELHVNNLELDTDDGTVTDDFVTTDPTIKGSIGGLAAGEGILVQIDTNGDGVFETEVYTDANGEFSYTPDLKPDHTGVGPNDAEGIEQGLNSISFRTVEEDNYGYRTYSQWNTINFVLHDDPDSAEAQTMKTARDQYDTDLQASRDNYRTSVQNAQNDYRSNRQTTRDTLENSLQNASDGLKTSQDAAYDAYHSGSQTVWNAYFTEIDNALGAMVGAGGSGLTYEIKEFFFSKFEEFAKIELDLPDSKDQPTPPTGLPSWEGPSHDYSKDETFQSVLQTARKDLETRLKNARIAKENSEKSEKLAYDAAVLGFNAVYWAGVAAAWVEYFASIPTEYTPANYADTIADYQKQITDVGIDRNQKLKAIDEKYDDLIAALIPSGGSPGGVNELDLASSIKAAEYDRDRELEKNKTNSVADQQITNLREQIIQFKADVKKWFAVTGGQDPQGNAVGGKLGAHLILQKKLADLLNDKEVDVAARGEEYVQNLADIIVTHDTEVADASKDYSTMVANAVRDAIDRRKTADPNPWWTYQLELADHALEYYAGDPADQNSNGKIGLTYDRTLEYISANHIHTDAVASATKDQVQTISGLKHARTYAHSQATHDFQTLKVNLEHTRTIARSQEWENLLDDHTLAKLGGSTMDVDGYLDELAVATFEKTKRELESHQKLWDIMNDPSKTAAEIAAAQAEHAEELAASDFAYELDVVGALDTRDEAITTAHYDHTYAVLTDQKEFLELTADGVTTYDTAIATADHGTANPFDNGKSSGGFYVWAAEANAAFAVDIVNAEVDWIYDTSAADEAYAAGESDLYKTWVVADATSLKNYQTSVINAWFGAIETWAGVISTYWTDMIKTVASNEKTRLLLIAGAALTKASQTAAAVNQNEKDYALARMYFLQDDALKNQELVVESTDAMVESAKRDHGAFYDRDVDTSQAITDHDKAISGGAGMSNFEYQVSIAGANKVLTDAIDDAAWLYRIEVANADYVKVRDGLTAAQHQVMLDDAMATWIDNTATAELARSLDLIGTWEAHVVFVSVEHVGLATDWKSIRDTFADKWKASRDTLASDLAGINIAKGADFTAIDKTLIDAEAAADKDWWTSVTDAAATFGGTVVKSIGDKLDGIQAAYESYVGDHISGLVASITAAIGVNAAEWQHRQKETAELEETRLTATHAGNAIYRAANKLNRDTQTDSQTDGNRAKGVADAGTEEAYVGQVAGTSKTYSDSITTGINNYSESLTAASTQQTVDRIKADTQYRVDINVAAQDREVGIAVKWREFVETMSNARDSLYRGTATQADYDALHTAELAEYNESKASLERQHGIDVAFAKWNRIKAYGTAMSVAANAVDLIEEALTGAFNLADSGYATGMKAAAVQIATGLSNAANTLTSAFNSAASTFLGSQRGAVSTAAGAFGDAITAYATGMTTQQWTHFGNSLTDKLNDWLTFDSMTSTAASNEGLGKAKVRSGWSAGAQTAAEQQTQAMGDSLKNQDVENTLAVNDRDQGVQTHRSAYDTGAGTAAKDRAEDGAEADGKLDEDVTAAINGQMTTFTDHDGVRLKAYAAAEKTRQDDLAEAEYDKLVALAAIEDDSTLTAQQKSDQIDAVNRQHEIERAIIQYQYKVATINADAAWRRAITGASQTAANASATAASTWETTLGGIANTFMQGVNGLFNTFMKDVGGTKDICGKAIDGNQGDVDIDEATAQKELNKADLQSRSDAFDLLELDGPLDASQLHVDWLVGEMLAAATNAAGGTGDHAVTRATDDKTDSQAYHDASIADYLTYRSAVGAASNTRAAAVGGAIAANINDDATAYNDLISELAAAGNEYTLAVIDAEEAYLLAKAEYEMYLAVDATIDILTKTELSAYTQADYDSDLAAAESTKDSAIAAAAVEYSKDWVLATTGYLLDLATNHKTHQTTINDAEKTSIEQIEDAKKLHDDSITQNHHNLIDAKSVNRQTANVAEATQIKDAIVGAVTALGAAATNAQKFEADRATADANQVTSSESQFSTLISGLNDAIQSYANTTSLAFQTYFKAMATHEHAVKQAFNEATRLEAQSSGGGLQTLANTNHYKTALPGAPQVATVTLPSLLEGDIESFFEDFGKPAYHDEMFVTTGQEGWTGEYHWSPDSLNLTGRNTRQGPSDLTGQTVRKDPTVRGSIDPYVGESVYSNSGSTSDTSDHLGGTGARLSGGSNKDVKAKLGNGKSGYGDEETIGTVLKDLGSSVAIGGAKLAAEPSTATSDEEYYKFLDELREASIPQNSSNLDLGGPVIPDGEVRLPPGPPLSPEEIEHNRKVNEFLTKLKKEQEGVAMKIAAAEREVAQKLKSLTSNTFNEDAIKRFKDSVEGVRIKKIRGNVFVLVPLPDGRHVILRSQNPLSVFPSLGPSRGGKDRLYDFYLTLAAGNKIEDSFFENEILGEYAQGRALVQGIFASPAYAVPGMHLIEWLNDKGHADSALEVTISTVGDSLLMGGMVVRVFSKGGKVAKTFFLADATFEGTIAAYRLGQAGMHLSEGDVVPAAFKITEGLMRALGAKWSAKTYYNYKVQQQHLKAIERLVRKSSSLEVLQQTCFAAGTPILTPSGAKPIEKIRQGDIVITRPEGNADGNNNENLVEEVTALTAPVVEVEIRGVVIRTTAKHPFYVLDRGWIPVEQLQAGDIVVGDDNKSSEISRVTPTNSIEEVFSIRVANDHTYFVGEPDWGFSIWVHNAYRIEKIGGKYQLLDSSGTVVGGPFKSMDDLLDFAQRSPGIDETSVVLAELDMFKHKMDGLVELAKPSTKGTLPRQPHQYVNPGYHQLGNWGSNYRNNKQLLPENHVELFKNSVVDPLNRFRRYTMDSSGQIHVFQGSQAGAGIQFHWSMVTGGKNRFNTLLKIDKSTIVRALQVLGKDRALILKYTDFLKF